MIDANTILQLVQEKTREGGSPWGISRWSKAAACGRQVVLEDAAKASAEEGGVFRSDAVTDRLDYFAVGTAYHLLHEHAIAPSAPWDARGPFSAEFKEAFRLYQAYCAKWGSFREKWGLSQCEAEVPLPRTPEGAAAVAAMYALEPGEQVTGRADMIGHISEDALDGVLDRTGVLLPGPGVYIFDLKTASKAGPDKYTDSLQACNYLCMYNAEHPHAPAVGMIFDEITKTAKPTFAHFVATQERAVPERIANLVRIGANNLKAQNGAGLCNPVGCSDYFRACYWRKSGQCPGF